MTTETWNGGAGGWGTLANWTGGIPNSTTADATIGAAGTYVVTVETGKSYSVDSVQLADGTAQLDVVGTLALGGTLALLNDAAGTLELAGVVSGGNVDIQSGATLEALGGVLTGEKTFYLGGSGYINLDNHALTLGGTSNLLGYVIGSGDLVISGLTTLSDDTYFESGVTLDDTGTIIATTSNQFANGGSPTTVLTIASTGTYDVTAVNAALSNNGTFDIINAGLFEMTGTNTPDGYVNIYNTSFTNTGTLLAIKGSDISLLQGHEDLAGAITGAGDLFIGQGATATLEAGLSLNIGVVTFSDGNTDIILESNRTIGSSFSEVNGANISLNGHTLTTSGTGNLAGYVSGPGTLTISGSFTNGGLYVGSGVEELVTGIVAQTNYARLDYDNGTAASVLSVASGGTYDITAVNSDIDYSGTGGTIINSGLFENITSLAAYSTGNDYSYFNVYENFTNSSAGTIYVGTADDISLVYGTNDLAGTITGPGDLYLGSTTTLEAGLVLTNGRYLTFSGANIYLKSNRSFGENLVIQGGANLQLDGYNATLANIGTLNGYITGPGTLDVTGTYFVGGLDLSSGITEVLSGIEIQNGESRLNYDNGTAAVVLSITGTGIYDITADSNLDDYNNNNATIINAGLFEKTGYDNYSNIYVDFTNTSTGTILAGAQTDISLLGATNDIAGTITGAGDIYFGNASIDTLEASAVISNSLAAFTVSDNNTQLYLESSRTLASTFTDQSSANVQLNGHTLTLAGTLAGSSQFTNGYVSGPGELIITGTSDFDDFLAIGSLTVLDKGTIIEDGYAELGTNSTANVVLSIASGAVLNLINDTYINPQGTSAIDNAGLFEKTAVVGASDIYAPVINLSTGTIAALEGELRLDGGGTLAGTLTGPGTIDINGGIVSLVSAAVTSVKNLDITSGELILEGSRSFTGAFNENGGTLALNGFNLSLANPGDYLANGYIFGPGTLSESGRVDLNNIYFTGGAVLKDTGTVTQDGNVFAGNSAADSAAITVGSTGIYDIVNDSYIYASGTSTINNSGLFEKTAGTGYTYIEPVFNNAAGATLKVASGTALLDGGGSLAGTLTGAGSLYLQTGTFGLAAAAVISVGTLGINGGQLNLLGSRTITGKFIESSGDLNLNGFNATLSAADNLYNAYLTGPGTLDVTGTTEARNYYVTGGAVLQDAGTIIADGNLFLGNAATDSGTLNISTGGVFDFTNDSYIYTYGTGAVNNAGLLEKTADNGTSMIYTPINNTGTINAVRGVIDLTNGGTLGGTLTGGTIELGGGTFALTSAAVLGLTQIDDYNAALSLQSNRAYGGIFNEYYGGGTIQLNGHTLTLSGADNFNGYVAGAGTLALSGTSDLNGYNLTQGALLLDTGTLTMDGVVQIGEAATDSATLSIASGGTFDILNDNYIYEDGTVAVVNSGLFEKTGSGTRLSLVEGELINAAAGTIALTTGILELQTLVNDSRVTVTNALLQTDYNVTADAGKTGAIVLGPNATLDDVAGIAASQTISFSGSNTELEIGNGVFAGTITGFSSADTIDLANTVANGFVYGGNRLTLTENGSVVGNLALAGIANPGSLSLVQDGNGGTDIEFGNPGTITQPSGAVTNDSFLIPNGQSTADFNTAADWSTGTVANALNTATYRSNNTAGTVTDSGTNTVYQFSFNDGALSFSQTGGVLNVIDGGSTSLNFFQSAGATINDRAGELQLYSNGGVAGTLGGAGAIELGGNSGNGYAPFSIASTAVLNVATLAFQDVILDGNQTYNGSFVGVDGGFTDLNGFTLTLNGAARLSPTYSYQFNGPGTLVVAGSAAASQFYVDAGAALDVTGTFTEDQNTYLGNSGADTASLGISTTGTYNLVADANISADSFSNLESLNNAGLLEKTGDSGTSNIAYVNYTQANTGVLDIARGTLLMQNDSGYIDGTVTGAGELEFSSSNITLASAATVNAATLSLFASDVLLAGSLNYAGDFSMANGGTLALGANNLTLSGTSSLGGAYVSGSGTLDITGLADMTGAQLQNTSELLDAGTIVQDGGFTLGYFATDATSLVISTGAVYDVINDNGIGVNGTASIYNAGLFEKTADNGDSNIYPSFTNASTGTLDVASGRIILQDGGTLNGTIEGAGVLYLQNNNGTFTLGAGAVLSVATLDNNDTLLLESSRSYAGNLINTNVLDLNGFNLTLTASAGLDGYVEGGGTLAVFAGDISGLYEYGGASVVDRGTLTQDGGFTIGNTATDTSSLSIASGAVFDLLTDNSINANGTASAIHNAGLFEKTGDYGTSYIYAGFTNAGTGTISLARGFINFQDGGTFNGTLTGGADGTIADGGVIFGNGLAVLASTAVVKTAQLQLAGGTLSLGANLNYAGFFEGTGGSLALNGHNLTLTSPYLGGFYLDGPGSATVSGTGTLNGLGQINGSLLVDKGTIIQDGGYQIGYTATDSSKLSITSTGTFDITTDNYIGASGAAATIVNAGLFEKTADNGYSAIQPFFTNQSTGVIDAARGQLAFTGGGVLGGTIKGAGEIVLSSAVTLASTAVTVGTIDIASQVTLGSNLTYGGYFINQGGGDNFILNSHTLVLTGTVAEDGGFEGPGVVTISGTASLNGSNLFAGATLVDTGFIAQDNVLYFSLSDNTSNTLAIGASGVYDLQDDSNFQNESTGAAQVVTNAGLLEKTGDTGLSDLQVTLSNTGTVLVTSGTLQIDASTNLAAGTLSGGSWIADTGLLGPILSIAGGSIAVDAASITLSGANSALIAGGTLIETSLTSVTSGGILAIGGGRNFLSTNAISDAGGIVLQAGTFADAGLTIATGASFTGTGTLAGSVLDNGLITATGSALTVEAAVTGAGSFLIDPHSELILGSGAASGTNITFGGSLAVLGLDAPGSVLSTLVSLAPSDTIDLIGTLVKSATISGSQLAVTLTTGGVVDYALANTTTLSRAAVVSDGHGGSDIAIFREATAGAITPSPVNLGEHHAGTAPTGNLTIANIAIVDPYSENLNATAGTGSGGVKESGSFSGVAPGHSNVNSLHVTLVTSSAGVVTGTAAVNLFSTGTGVAGDDNGTVAIGSESVAVTGTFFNYATAAITPKPFTTGQHHVGDVITQFVTIANTAAPGLYSENLDASFSGTAADLIGTGSFAGLAAGGTNSSSLAITLASAIAGVETGNATIKLTSDTAGIDRLSNTGLTSQTVTVSGTLFNYATATAATPAPVDLGIIHVGSTFGEYLTFSNAGVVGKYTENLDGNFTGTSSNIIASGTLSELAAGSTTKGSLKLQVNTGSAGTITGTTTLALTSDGKGIDSLGTTALAGQIITVIGTVNNYATIGVETIAGSGTLSGTGTTRHLNLGSTTAGSAALTENIGVLNNTTGPSDLLSGSFSLSGSSLYSNTSFGSFASLTAGSADANPTISLGTGTIGTFQETIVVHGTGSNASGYSAAVGSETIIVVGTITAAPMVFVAAATPSAATPAATPITGSDAVRSFDALSTTPAAAKVADEKPTFSFSSIGLGGYLGDDLIKPPTHGVAASHAAILAGLG